MVDGEAEAAEGAVGMVRTAALAAWALPAIVGMLQGEATYYAEGLMEQVAENRAMDLRPFVGGVALNRAGDLGRVVWLEWEAPDGTGGTVEGPFLSVDCAREGKDYERRELEGRIVEVDWEVAVRRGFAGVGPVGVKVWYRYPYVGLLPGDG